MVGVLVMPPNPFRRYVLRLDFNELLGKTIACISHDPKVRELIERDRQRLRHKERKKSFFACRGDFEERFERKYHEAKKAEPFFKRIKIRVAEKLTGKALKRKLRCLKPPRIRISKEEREAKYREKKRRQIKVNKVFVIKSKEAIQLSLKICLHTNLVDHMLQECRGFFRSKTKQGEIMKKLMLVVFAMCLLGVAKADPILDQLYAGFVGRAKLAIESTTSGKSQAEFLVNYVEIGQVNGNHIMAVDAGILGTILPDNGHFKAADWTTGAKIHLSPVLRSFIPLPAEWEFLKTLEIDARASYNWRQHHPFYGIVADVPFR